MRTTYNQYAVYFLALAFTLAFLFLFACKSEPKVLFSQEIAQDVIKKYVTNHGFEHLDELVTGQAITKMDTATFDGDKKASIRVHFINEGQTQRLVLVFNFDNPTGKYWVLNSMRSEGKVSNELADWLAKKSGLNVPVK
ncbi:MAG: hypothetical protein WBP41_02975 [Saprospiraceae bacterium]